MWETHIIPLHDPEEGGEKYLVYRPLQGIAFIGNQAMVNAIREINERPDLSAGRSGASKITAFLDEIGFFRSDALPGEAPQSYSTAVLLLTNRCQLRCTYCYAAAGESRPKVLKAETARAVIDAICARAEEQGRPGYRLEFHGGGEPTLEWDVLTEAVEYARAKPLKANISITSNAIWSDAQCAWLIDHMDSLSISMDGDEVTQNTNRPLASGKPSFPIVLKNLRRLDEGGARYGIRMTAIAPWDHLAKNIAFIAESTRCRHVQVEPAFHPVRGSHGLAEDDEYQKFSDAFKEAYLTAKKFNLHLRYAPARVGMTTRQFCSAPYDAIVVNPEDQIVACYEVTSLGHPLGECSNFGYVQDGKVYLNEENRRRLHALIDDRFQHCQECFCHWTCAGDCYVRSFQPGEGGHLLYGDRCKMNRELTTFLLLQRIADHGGVWRGYRAAQENLEHLYG